MIFMELCWDYAAGMFLVWFLYAIVLGCMCLVALIIDIGVEKTLDILVDKLFTIENKEIDDLEE